MAEPAIDTKPVAKRKLAVVEQSSPANGLDRMVEQALQTGDVGIIERVVAMRDRMIAQQDERAFNDKMAKTQARMRPVATDANNPQTRSRYASYAALDRALRPIYTEDGFALSFNTGDGAPENHIRVLCDVTNCGHTRRYKIDMPADGKGAKGGDVMTKTHATGSAASYGMRYLLKMIFNVAVGEADDDGNAAGNIKPTERITEKQEKELTALMEKASVEKQIIFEHFKVSELSELTPTQHATAINKLNKKLGK